MSMRGVAQSDRHMVGGVAAPGLSPPAFGREVPPRTASPQSPQLRCYSLVGTAQTRPERRSFLHPPCAGRSKPYGLTER
ncbi:hypothetical protein GCM10010442_67870 [Kitasatospora kifunensis]